MPEMRLRLTRILILFISVLLLSNWALAQRRKPENLPFYDNAPYHFGFVLGVNQMLFTIKPYENFYQRKYITAEFPDKVYDSASLYSIESNPNYGFTIGIVSNLRVGNPFDLRFIPSLSFGERDITYRIKAQRFGTDEMLTIRKPVQSTYLEFPLLFRYKSARLNNVRSYIIGGTKYSLDLISDAKRKEKTNETIIKLRNNDLYLELGVGFDFYTEYFKFGTEVKMSYGLRDLLTKEGNIYTEGIEYIRSKIFSINFTFE